jgi:hypothetical protein
MLNHFPASESKSVPLASGVRSQSMASRRTKVTALTVTLTTIALVFLTAAPAHAQRRVRPPFRVGQTVEFDWAGQTMQGEVVAVDKFSGWADVRYEENGEKKTRKLPPAFLRAVKKDPPAKAAAGKQGTDGENARPELREWSDISGAHKITARFVKLAEDKVTLEKEDGSEVAIQLTKLSEADQKLAQKLAKGDDESPFVTVKPSGSSPASEKNSSRAAAVEGDWSGVRTVTINASAKAAIPADAAAWEKIPTLRPTDLGPFADDDQNDVFESMCGMFLHRPRQLLIVASINRDPQKHPGARVEACDLKTARSLGAITLGTPKPPVDLSPDGSCVVCAPDWRMADAFQTSDGGVPRGVEVWRLAKGGSLVKRWLADGAESAALPPSAGRTPEERRRRLAEMAGRGLNPWQSDQAFFISDAQVMTVNRNGTMTLWNVADARAIYTLKAGLAPHPALSANRKQMAVVADGRICILDPASGKTVAAFGEKRGLSGPMAFRPDGKQLAICSMDELEVWDLAAKRLAAEIWFPPNSRAWGEHLQWIDDQHVLLDGSTLFDLGRQIILWKFKPGAWTGGCAIDGSLCCFYEPHRQAKAALGFLALPQPEAARVAESLKLEETMALLPGGRVSLDLQSAVSGDDLKTLTAAVEEQLNKKGISVVAGAPVTLRASVENGETRSTTYRSMGPRGRGTETVTTTARTFRMTYAENGKVLWEAKGGSGGTPKILRTQADVSAQQAVNDMQARSPLTFFMSRRLPDRLVRYGENGCFGTSALAPAPGATR